MTQEIDERKTDSKLPNTKQDEKPKEKKGTLPTKVVVRRLPPTLTRETFIEQISPIPDYDYLQFVKADLSLADNAFTRAYINFLQQDDIFLFCEKFDGYVFVDNKGNEYTAVVEFAPYQKIPKSKPKKTDSKKGTVEQDPDYLKFLENQKKLESDSIPAPEVYLQEIEAREKELKANSGAARITTPLLEFIKRKREEKRVALQRAKDERKRRETDRRRQREDERKRRKDKEQERARELDRRHEQERARDTADRRHEQERTRDMADRRHEQERTRDMADRRHEQERTRDTADRRHEQERTRDMADRRHEQERTRDMADRRHEQERTRDTADRRHEQERTRDMADRRHDQMQMKLLRNPEHVGKALERGKDQMGHDKDSVGRDKDSVGRDKDSVGRDKDLMGRDKDSVGRHSAERKTVPLSSDRPERGKSREKAKEAGESGEGRRMEDVKGVKERDRAKEKEKPSAVYKKVSREPDRYRAEHSFIGSKVPSKSLSALRETKPRPKDPPESTAGKTAETVLPSSPSASPGPTPAPAPSPAPTSSTGVTSTDNPLVERFRSWEVTKKVESADSDSANKQRVRYKDRPERAIYNPGRRAAERRKEAEAKAKDSPGNT